MCGIAGFQGNFDADLLTRMSGMLAHRGPDHQAVVYDHERLTGLVHTRLSIIDLSPRSNQPLWDATRRYCIVFNGEIYNYRALRDELAEDGFAFATEGDAEVILNAYIRDGERCLARLNGIFAFAIWDKAAGELCIARDPFGVKPLYYAQTAQGVVFASELKALLCEPAVPRQLDYTALWQYLTLLWSPSPHTPLLGVRKLEPGYLLRVKDRAISAHRQYMEYPPFSPTLDMPAEQAAQELRTLLEQAVQRQLVSDVPVGAFLSGGVDSSALAYFGAKALGGRLQCFTIELLGHDQEGMSEDLPYAKLMAERLQVPLDIVQISPDVVHDLPRMLFALDEPQADPAPLNAMYIAERARDMGIKVLLSGAGGDDLFAGYRRHFALLQEPIWSWLPGFGRRALAGLSTALPQHHSTLRRFAKAFAYADLSQASRLTSYFYWINPQQSLALFNPFIRERLAQQPVDTQMTAMLGDGVAGPIALNQMLYLEQKFFLIDHNFNYTDKTSMAAGVETRVPFLDPDLVAFANRLPAHFKYRGRDSKWILKQALQGLLPDGVLHRKKSGFGAPLRSWLRGPLRPWVDEMLSEQVIRQRGIFDPVAVRKLVRADRENQIDAAYTIFSVACIETWARQFIDPPVPTPTL